MFLRLLLLVNIFCFCTTVAQQFDNYFFITYEISVNLDDAEYAKAASGVITAGNNCGATLCYLATGLYEIRAVGGSNKYDLAEFNTCLLSTLNQYAGGLATVIAIAESDPAGHCKTLSSLSGSFTCNSLNYCTCAARQTGAFCTMPPPSNSPPPTEQTSTSSLSSPATANSPVTAAASPTETANSEVQPQETTSTSAGVSTEETISASATTASTEVQSQETTSRSVETIESLQPQESVTEIVTQIITTAAAETQSVEQSQEATGAAAETHSSTQASTNGNSVNSISFVELSLLILTMIFAAVR